MSRAFYLEMLEMARIEKIFHETMHAAGPGETEGEAEEAKQKLGGEG